MTRRLAGPWQTDCMKPLKDNCQAKFSVRLYSVGDAKLMCGGGGEECDGERKEETYLVGGGEARQNREVWYGTKASTMMLSTLTLLVPSFNGGKQLVSSCLLCG